MFDYSPSVPHQPKVSDVIEEVGEEEIAHLESGYRRNSPKLLRIGIEAGSSSDSIADFGKKIVSSDK